MLEKPEPSKEEIEARRRALVPRQSYRKTERELEKTKAKNEELQKGAEAANIDSLTELLNRRGFEAKVRAEYENLPNARRIGDANERAIMFVMIDIDKFKGINDTYGHDAGDEVLRDVARYLRNYVRSSDVVGRRGGEEFVLALANSAEVPAVRIADELRQGVENLHIQWKGQHIPVTVSMGVADSEDTATMEEAISAADRALYAAKAAGRNRVERSSRVPESIAA